MQSLVRASGMRGVLFSSLGLSSQGQALARELMQFRPTLRQNVYAELIKWRPGSRLFQLGDTGVLKPYLDMLSEVEKLPAPNPGYSEMILVPGNDYARQAQISLVTKDGQITAISLENAFNFTLAGKSSLNTGSGNSFESSNMRATNFARTLGIDVLRAYLAMDPVWWPYNEGLIPLVEKNILTDMVLVDANSVVNAALKVNPDLTGVMGFTHSYGNFSRAMALSTFDAIEIPEARTIMSAPLGIDLDIAALLEAKNGYYGKVSIVRPGFDWLEEILGMHQTIMGRDIIYEQLPTDLRLATSSHNLDNIAAAFQQKLRELGIDVVQFNEKYYTARPGKVTSFRSSDGTETVEIVPRSGTMEAFVQQYEQAATQEKAALADILNTQASLLEEVVKYAPPSPELQSIATSIEDAITSLNNAALEDLPAVLRQVNATITTLHTSLPAQVAEALKNAQQQGDTQWEEGVNNLNTQLEQFSSNAEEARGKIDDMEEGRFEPTTEGL